jgi:hypothetical protein
MARSPRLIAVFLGVMLWSSSVVAHGPVPAALGIAALDDNDSPWLIRLSEGLAFRESEGIWRYGCAQAWDLPLTPIVAQVSTECAWLVGSEHLFRIRPHGPPEPWSGPGPDAKSVLQMVRSSDHEITLLARIDNNTELWRLTIDTIAPLQTYAEPWRGLAIYSNELHLVRVDGADVLHLRMNLDGTWRSSSILVGIDGTNQTPQLHATQSGLFLSLRSANRTHLWRLEPNRAFIWEGSGQMLGPVGLGSDPSDVLIASGGELIRLRDDSVPEIQETPIITCLEEGTTVPYACNLRTVIALEENTGKLTTPIFDVGSILPPNADRVPDDAWAICELDWLDFAADGNLDPYGTAPKVEPPPPPQGCSTANTSHRVYLLAMMFWAAFRRPSRPARPSPQH